MRANAAKTVRELAVELPNATRVFEKLGIDYCCGGKKSLQEACTAARLPVDQVLKELETSAQTVPPAEFVLPSGSLQELIAHIVNTHHQFTREEIVRLQALLDKVCAAHGKNHPELLTIREVFQALAQELSLHLMKEENILFPYVVRMEESVVQKDPILPAPFGSVQNPVHMMMLEHDGAGESLRRIRAASNNFALPADACTSYQVLYQALQGFEADLHQHIHLENNLLFPRVLELEESAPAATR